MALDRHVYERVVRDVDVPVLCCLHLGLLALKYPGVLQDTICAIFAQENQYKVLKSHHTHKASMDTYCRRYLDGEDLLALCADVDFPPCLLMRRMLEEMLGLSKQRVSDMLKQPALLQNVDAAAALQLWQQRAATQQHQHHAGSRLQHSQLVPARHLQPLAHKNSGSSTLAHTCSSSLDSGRRWDPQRLLHCLQHDVVRCIHADRSYSPYCDMAKSLAGLEHEALLYQRLRAAGVPFWTEQQLRERGLFKTPDALLQIPLCIRGTDQQWHMVHWLDSKASFGDDRTHNQQMEGQYATYVNRYGPGCVIYWFGFITDLSVTVHGQAHEAGGSNHSSSHLQQVDVVLRDNFPAAEEILQLPQQAAATAARPMLSISAAGAPAGLTVG